MAKLSLRVLIVIFSFAIASEVLAQKARKDDRMTRGTNAPPPP